MAIYKIVLAKSQKNRLQTSIHRSNIARNANFFGIEIFTQRVFVRIQRIQQLEKIRADEFW